MLVPVGSPLLASIETRNWDKQMFLLLLEIHIQDMSSSLIQTDSFCFLQFLFMEQ